MVISQSIFFFLFQIPCSFFWTLCWCQLGFFCLFSCVFFPLFFSSFIPILKSSIHCSYVRPNSDCCWVYPHSLLACLAVPSYTFIWNLSLASRLLTSFWAPGSALASILYLIHSFWWSLMSLKRNLENKDTAPMPFSCPLSYVDYSFYGSPLKYDFK